MMMMMSNSTSHRRRVNIIFFSRVHCTISSRLSLMSFQRQNTKDEDMIYDYRHCVFYKYPELLRPDSSFIISDIISI